MITYQNRGGKVRAIVRRKGIGSKSKSFATKGTAKIWAERIERKTYATHADARADVLDYIEMFYNPKRRHGSIGGLSPVEFEKRFVENGS